jgi:hypothetical protein
LHLENEFLYLLKLLLNPIQMVQALTFAVFGFTISVNFVQLGGTLF